MLSSATGVPTQILYACLFSPMRAIFFVHFATADFTALTISEEDLFFSTLLPLLQF
jgi:hypothetical protein